MSAEPKPTTVEERLAQEAAESWATYDNKTTTGASWYDEEMRRLRKQLDAEQRQVSWMRDVIKRLEQQLAAERQNRDDALRREYENAQLLAAEQSKLRDAEILCAELQRNRDEIHQQLAAEREKVQALTAVLKRAEGAIRSEDHVKMGLALVVMRDKLNWIRAEDNPGFHRHE